MNIRPTQPDDLPLLSEYWYDRAALLSQMHPHIKLLPDARKLWQAAAHELLNNAICLSGIINEEVSAGIIGKIERNQPGLAPEHYGLVRYLIIDLHRPHQRGMGRELLQALNAEFKQRGIRHVQADSPLHLAVEQAFWRGMGATLIQNSFWMDL